MIELKGLSKNYTISGKIIKALQPLDLSIDQGNFVSIVGHSGSGKSTFLSLVGGIARPDTGTVVVDGTNIWDYDDKGLSKLRNEKFGFVYQFASLIPTLTATENVLLPTVFGGKKTTADAVRLLQLVGLGDKVDRYPSELSGGEQQRVAIARAFIHDPCACWAAFAAFTAPASLTASPPTLGMPRDPFCWRSISWAGCGSSCSSVRTWKSSRKRSS